MVILARPSVIFAIPSLALFLLLALFPILFLLFLLVSFLRITYERKQPGPRFASPDPPRLHLHHCQAICSARRPPPRRPLPPSRPPPPTALTATTSTRLR